MKKNTNTNGNGNGFVATIEPKNGNGKKKAEYKVPELPVEEKSEPVETVSRPQTDFSQVEGDELAAVLAGIYLNENVPSEIDSALDAGLTIARDNRGIVLDDFQTDLGLIKQILKTKPIRQNAENWRIRGDYVHQKALPELLDAILKNEDMPTRFWNTIFDSLCDMNGEPLMLMPTVEQIWQAVNRENCRGLQIKRQTDEPEPEAKKTTSAQEISETETLEVDTRDEYLEMEAKAKDVIEDAISSNNFEKRRKAITELLNLKLSDDLSESLLSWLEPQAVDGFAPKDASAHDDCVIEAARDLEFLIREETSTPEIQKYIEKGVRIAAQCCNFPLTDNKLDAQTIANIIWHYAGEEEAGRIQDEAFDYDAHHNQATANELNHVLNSEKVSEDVKSAIRYILSNASNNSDFDWLDGGFIHISFPFLVEGMGTIYARATIDSLQAILDSLPREVVEEVNELRESFNASRLPRFQNKPAPNVLDLTATDSDTDDTQFTKLANSLSEILENPKTPDDLFNAVVGQLDLICGNELSKKLKDPEVIKQGLIHDQQQSEPESVTPLKRAA